MKHPNKKRSYPFKRHLRRKLRRILFMVIAAAIAGGLNYYNKNKQTIPADNGSSFNADVNSSKLSKSNQQLAIQKIRAAKDQNDSRFWISLNGKVIKKLKDDLKGSRHQKFLIKISDDITLLVAHNIDLANRIPIEKGDQISLRGRYEWNHRGGVIHWTHHDPKGKKQGGWVQLNGKRYR